MTIWEEHGISLEDYAKAFNKALDEAWERILENRAYLVDNEPRVFRIINIGDTNK